MTLKEDSNQFKILEFIYDTVESRGFPPTVREICEAVNLSSTSTVHGHLNRLVKAGYLYKDPSKPRALEITQDGLNALGIDPGIPYLGTVAAGDPDTALADDSGVEFYVERPEKFDKREPLYMLKVEGLSMIERGIYPEDMVIVRHQNDASLGDLVIAYTENNGTTLKELTKDRQTNELRLKAYNKEMYPDDLLPDTHFKICGKVISLNRNY
ncbi:transcriptional repressor LexA [Lactobacillus psittaci]|uniref:Repressor LexA n=1 Tax=Lactobacillus psittaci DSM 15354 TaxID=1122152 RepID=A0A0R1S5W0_9LACO|nr:transcriptional repressor LexA [Lactobacillus psittaci]KRL64009.1 repressor LexA [Lactobacillus psittaci DSM 15354]